MCARAHIGPRHHARGTPACHVIADTTHIPLHGVCGAGTDTQADTPHKNHPLKLQTARGALSLCFVNTGGGGEQKILDLYP